MGTQPNDAQTAAEAESPVQARSGGAGGEDDLAFFYALHVIWSSRLAIGVLTAAAVAVTLVYSLCLPKIYESSATIVAPKEARGGGLLSSIASSGLLDAVSGASLPSLTPDLDLFVSILESRSVREAAARQFDLMSRYQTEHLDDAVAALEDAVTVAVSKEGVVSITVEETDPRLAADIANFFADELDRKLLDYGNTRGARRRKFLEGRLTATQEDLRCAEEALREFQKTHTAFALSEQARGVMDTAAVIQGHIIATQVELESLRTYATETNPQVVVLKKQLAELNRQLAEMQFGKAGLDTGAVLSPLVGEIGEGVGVTEAVQVPFSEYPDLSLELARLTRDVKLQSAVYTLLTQQLEEAKIAEVMDIPSVQVLDRAVPAVRKSRPRIRRNMILAGFTGLFLGIIAALGRRYVETLRRGWREAEKTRP